MKDKKGYEKKISAIYGLLKEITLSLNEDRICSAVLDAAEKILDFGNIDLFLMDERGENLQLKECRGLKKPNTDTIIPLSGKKGITACVARTGTSLYIPDVRKDNRYLMGLQNARSELSVPLKIKERILGVLDVESQEIDAFTEEDRTLLEMLALQTSVALENARLFRDQRETHEMYKTLVHTSPEAIIVTDLQGTITYVSPRTQDLHGYDNPDDLVGMNAFQLIAPEHRKGAEKDFESLREEKFIKNKVYTLVRKDGSEFIGEINASIINNSCGEPIAHIATSRDITDRKRSEKQLENLFKASKLLNSTMDMEKIYRFLSHSLQDIVKFDNFMIFLVSEDKEVIYPAFVSENLAPLMKDVTLSYGEGLVGHCIKTKELLRIDDAGKDTRGKLIHGTDICVSQILVPLIVENEVVGALHISKSTKNAYDDQDVVALQPLGEIISSALRNSRIYDNVKKFGEELERRIEERSHKIEILLNTRQTLQRERSWEKGLHIIVDSMRNLGFDRCGIALVNSTHGTLDYHYGKGIDLPEIGTSISLTDSQYFGVECVIHKKTIYVKDTTHVKGKQMTSDSHSFVWVPIIVQDTAFAALAADNVEPQKEITEDDVKDLEILASMCAAFIDRTRIVIEPVAENESQAEFSRYLDTSDGYIVLEKRPTMSLEIFFDHVTHGIPGFIISREYPEKLRRKLKLVKTPMIWLSHSEVENTVSPNDLSKLNFILQDFIKQSRESVILFDGVEYLITQTNFNAVLKYLQTLKDIVVIGNSRLIIPLYEQTLLPKEYSQLQKEFIILNVE
ncbi:MAG: GAF domain-containing protein [Theionarchaea archaeon]|nr:GAF domain-containing protein [Theionarchaea archaeon]